MKNKILLVDDDEFILDSTKTALETENYEVFTAANGKQAIDFFKLTPIPVVITDIQMPEMNGFELANNLLLFENKPVILVQSVATDMNQIIELMQKGVYDYLIKPYNFKELILRVKKAYEAAEFRILKANLEKEREVRITHMLNWNKWKEGVIKRDQDRVDGNLIGSIRTSFSQGTGLGSLLSAIGRIQKKAKETETCFEVSKPMMNFLFENATNAKRIIEVLEEIDSIQTSEIILDNYSISEIHSILYSVSQTMNDYTNIKNHKFIICEDKFSHYTQRVRIHPEYIKKAITELLFNAIKFSIPNSKIYIMLELKNTNIFISVLSSPEKDNSGVNGILPEYSNIIFEPFFRISKLVFESIPTLDFGLGLTMADKVIRRHNGKIKAANLTSYLFTNETGSPGTLVDFEIELPLEE
jgi:YesN/AraC family two-component response regulator